MKEKITNKYTNNSNFRPQGSMMVDNYLHNSAVSLTTLSGLFFLFIEFIGLLLLQLINFQDIVTFNSNNVFLFLRSQNVY